MLVLEIADHSTTHIQNDVGFDASRLEDSEFSIMTLYIKDLSRQKTVKEFGKFLAAVTSDGLRPHRRRSEHV